MSAFGFGDLAFLGAVGTSTTPWTPANITTALWLDANDASTITTVSGAVSQWNDKSGNGRNATQPTESSRPTYQASGQNQLASILFNGSSQHLIFPNSNVSGYPLKFITTSFELYAVIDPSSLASSTNIFFGARRFTSGWMAGFSSNRPAFRMFTSTDIWLPYPMSALTATTGAQIFGATAPRGNRGEYRKDAVLLLTTNANVSASSINDSGATVCIGSYMDNSNAPTGFFSGSICEIILIGETLLDINNRTKVEGYLAHKWGLTANLPADHPYKSAAPTV